MSLVLADRQTDRQAGRQTDRCDMETALPLSQNVSQTGREQEGEKELFHSQGQAGKK